MQTIYTLLVGWFPEYSHQISQILTDVGNIGFVSLLVLVFTVPGMYITIKALNREWAPVRVLTAVPLWLLPVAVLIKHM